MAAGALLVLLAAVALDDDALWFENEVRPVFEARCASCHSGSEPDGGLDLGSTDGIATAIDVAGVVVRGDVDGSRLVQAIRYTDADLRMPPKGRIDDASIAVLEEWVRRGAPLPEGAAARAGGGDFDLEARWREHWSWRPVADPRAPLVSHAARVKDPLDAFVFERLEAAGLAPNDEAPRAAWLRRATYAVTGLPPTPDELAAFLGDTRPDAFEHATDRLLASPRFGERFARHWLDLVRYAETKAHEFDFPSPNAFAYRDYVVRAFDADVPYDRFVLEHVAGDLLAGAPEGVRLDPSGTFDESILGTGWWHLYEDVHSPVDTRADECDRLANQVDTFGKTFLGLTVACARCHDHKFDAITAEDYHALSGFALSSSYAQVRYETRGVEADVARELAKLRAEHGDELRAIVGAFLTNEVDALEPLLVPAALRAAGPPSSFVANTPPPSGAPGADRPLAPWMDVVLEDFEEGTFASDGLGPWTATGAAFVPRPLTRADCPPWHDVEGFSGNGFVNAHAGHGVDEVAAGDEPTGRLASAPFVVTHAHLHFLVSGGDHEGTRVVLELEEDGAWSEVRRAVGQNSNTFAPRRFDVAEFEGRRVRLVAIDEERGGWGHIGLDRIVASDAVDTGALERARTRAEWNAFLASTAGDDANAEELARVAARLDRSRSSRGESAFERLADLTRPIPSLGAPPRRDDHVVVDLARFAQNGSAFVWRRAGDLVFGADGAPSIIEMDAAVAEPGFHVLVASPQSEQHGGDLSYDQAGTTLLSPTFALETGRVAYLVRGRGRVFACVDSHRMLSGPLHIETLTSFDTHGVWQWIEHDLSKHVGAHVHVEFTAQVDGVPLDLAVARIVEERPPAIVEETQPKRGTYRGPGGHDQESEAEFEKAVTERCEKALAEWRRDIAAFTSGTGSAPTLAALLAHARLEGRTAALDAALAPFLERERAVLARLVPQSRLAPALIDLDGRDEFVLRRGDAHSPTTPAPRREPAAVRLTKLAGDDALVEPGGGSGRLALARALVDPRHPLVARVWTNRVWHHLFGTGLVATCDDFGSMGEAPSHPELLDALARDFVADGWSTKRLVRRVLLSDAFRRTSGASADQLAADPTNRLLARASVRRLDAEALRDALLFTSGALDETRFGPAVPVHLTAFMNGRGRPGDSGPLDGANRRSIYQAVRRNFIAPFMSVFDFPVPSATRGVRSVSNVPAQALALVNDPFVALCAERFGARALARAGDDSARIAWMYEVAFTRPPSAHELASALDFVASVGDDAQERVLAFTDLAHTLYQLEEFAWLP
jgi:hypothetical protein